MVALWCIWYILTISQGFVTGQGEKPFLRSLIETGFARSEVNVVYFTTSGSGSSGSYLVGDFPRVLLSRLGSGRRGWLRIATQSLVVIDGRAEPMGKCLTYLLGELARIVNPGSSKFVLLVDRACTHSSPSENNWKALHDALLSCGIGYSAVLSFARNRSEEEHPVSVTRISFGELATFAPAKLPVDLWSLFRLDIRSLDGVRVAGLLHNFIPFTYIDRSGRWTGTDFYLWNIVAGQLRLRLQLIHAKPNESQFVGGVHSPAMRTGLVHFVATRDLLVADSQPKVHLYARDHLSLIVPRPSTRTLMDALLQPFTMELWILIAVFVGVRVVSAYLTVWGSFQVRPWSGWIGLAADVLTFVLIEAYLAKVTSLLLTLRYAEGPRTLDQFLDARLPILQPLDTKYIQFQAGPELTARLQERFVRLSISELRRSTDTSYVELRSRVLQLAHGEEPYDAATGRRNFYILDEPLAVVHLQYSFGKESAFKQIVERCMGQYEENGLRVRVEQHYERWAQVQQLRKQYGINGTVLSFHDLQSLWICVALGWCISGAVFLAECTLHFGGKALWVRFGRKK